MEAGLIKGHLATSFEEEEQPNKSKRTSVCGPDTNGGQHYSSIFSHGEEIN